MRGFQRKYLRGLAHHFKPVVQVGQAGITEEIMAEVRTQLLAHELIKVRLRWPEDKKAMARRLAEGADAELCGLVGHTVILYRPHPTHPKIVLPDRPEPKRSRGRRRMNRGEESESRGDLG